MSKMLEKLKKAASDMKGGNFKEAAEGMWKCELDAAGNGSAVIRFLPAPNEDVLPFSRLFKHAFKGETTQKWLIDNCATTIGKPCPICEANSPLWKTGTEENKKIVRTRKRKVQYFANVLVLEDKLNPANQGKIFKFQFNQPIWKKIEEAMSPPLDADGNLIDPDCAMPDGFDPFDLKAGADFRISIYEKDGFSNFDRSKFRPNAPATVEFDDIKDQLQDLHAILDPKEFKSYEEIERRFKEVWDGVKAPAKPSEDDDLLERKTPAKKASDDGDDDLVALEKKSSKKEAKKVDLDDGDDLEYFRNLSKDD